MFDRGYYKKTSEILREFEVILQNRYNNRKPYAKYIDSKDYSNCSSEEKFLLKNINLMFENKPLEVDL